MSTEKYQDLAVDTPQGRCIFVVFTIFSALLDGPWCYLPTQIPTNDSAKRKRALSAPPKHLIFTCPYHDRASVAYAAACARSAWAAQWGKWCVQGELKATACTLGLRDARWKSCERSVRGGSFRPRSHFKIVWMPSLLVARWQSCERSARRGLGSIVGAIMRTRRAQGGCMHA